jgi:hypothetical protein
MLWEAIGGTPVCHAGEFRRTEIPRQLEFTKITEGSIPQMLRWGKAALIIPAEGPALDFPIDGLSVDTEAADLDSLQMPIEATFGEEADLHLYLVYGWSTSGLDELRSATLDSAQIVGKSIEIWTSRPVILYPPGTRGTADMRFVGWDIAMGNLRPGEYTTIVYTKRDTLRRGTDPGSGVDTAKIDYRLWKEFKVTVEEGD